MIDEIARECKTLIAGRVRDLFKCRPGPFVQNPHCRDTAKRCSSIYLKDVPYAGVHLIHLFSELHRVQLVRY